MPRGPIYTATLDVAGIRSGAAQANTIFTQMATRANVAQSSISSRGATAALATGLVWFGAFSIITQAIKATIRVFVSFVRITAQASFESAKLADAFDQAGKKMTVVLGGNKQAADDLIKHIQRTSAEVGLGLQDALKISRSFLPEVTSVDQLDRILFITRALASEDPQQGILGARITLEEALSGNTLTFKKRFEGTVAEIKILRDYQKQLGVTAGTVKGFTEILSRRGFTEEGFNNSLEQAIGRLTLMKDVIQISFGEPISSAFTDSINSFFEIFKDNTPQIEFVAQAFGEVISTATELLAVGAKGFFSEFTLEQVATLTKSLQSLVTHISDLAGSSINPTVDSNALTSLDKAVTLTDKIIENFNIMWQFLSMPGNFFKSLGTDFRDAGLSSDMEDYTNVVTDYLGITEQLQPLEDVLGVVNPYDRGGFLSGLTVSAAAGGKAVIAAVKANTLLNNEIKPLIKEIALLKEGTGKEVAITNLESKLAVFQSDYQALLDIYRKFIGIVNNTAQSTLKTAAINAVGSGKKLLEDQQKIDALLEESKKKKTTPDLSAIDAILAAKHAEVVATDAEQKAIERVDAAFLKELEKFNNKLIDLNTKSVRSNLDLFQELADKRIAAQKSFLRKLEDIARKHSRRLQDAKSTLGNSGSNLARRQSREKVKFERDIANKRIDIERNFRQTIRDIQLNFSRSAGSAAKSRDAIAYLKAIEDRDFALQDANLTRGDDLESLRLDEQNRRTILQESQRQQIEDAKIADAQKLQDIQDALARELEDAKIARDRKFKDIEDFGNKKEKALKKSFLRQQADADQAHARAIKALNARLSKELALIIQFEARKTAAMQASRRAISNRRNLSNPGSRGIHDRPNTRDRPVLFAHGGSMIIPPGFPNDSFLAGVSSGEMLTVLTPMQQKALIRPSSRASTTNSNVVNNVTTTIDPGSLSPQQSLQVSNIVSEILGGLF